jgi:hypothetical protein
VDDANYEDFLLFDAVNDPIVSHEYVAVLAAKVWSFGNDLMTEVCRAFSLDE